MSTYQLYKKNNDIKSKISDIKKVILTNAISLVQFINTVKFNVYVRELLYC